MHSLQKSICHVVKLYMLLCVIYSHCRPLGPVIKAFPSGWRSHFIEILYFSLSHPSVREFSIINMHWVKLGFAVIARPHEMFGLHTVSLWDTGKQWVSSFWGKKGGMLPGKAAQLIEIWSWLRFWNSKQTKSGGSDFLSFSCKNLRTRISVPPLQHALYTINANIPVFPGFLLRESSY